VQQMMQKLCSVTDPFTKNHDRSLPKRYIEFDIFLLTQKRSLYCRLLKIFLVKVKKKVNHSSIKHDETESVM